MKDIEKKLFDICSKLIPVGKSKSISLAKGNDYKYSTLSDMQLALKTPLAKVGLQYRFVLNNPSDVTTIQLIITDGDEMMSFSLPIHILNSQNVAQDFGSYTTYYSKYLLRSTFNLLTEDDNDASDVKTVQRRPLKENETEIINKIADYMRNGGSKKEVEAQYILSEKMWNIINDKINQ